MTFAERHPYIVILLIALAFGTIAVSIFVEFLHASGFTTVIG